MIQWMQDKILNVNSDIYMYTSSFLDSKFKKAEEA